MCCYATEMIWCQWSVWVYCGLYEGQMNTKHITVSQLAEIDCAKNDLSQVHIEPSHLNWTGQVCCPLQFTHTHTHTTVLWLSGFCPVQPGWAGTRRNIHPLTPIVVISYLLPPFITIHGILPVQFTCLTVFFHNLSPSFTNHCLLFRAHAHTIATLFAVVLRLCHLLLVSLSTHYLELYLLNVTHPSNHSRLCPLMGQVSLPCNILLT